VSRVFGPLQLHFEPLHADLKAVHGLDGRLRAGRVVKAHEAKTFALVGGPIHKHLGGDDIAEGQEHLRQLRVSKLLLAAAAAGGAAAGGRCARWA